MPSLSVSLRNIAGTEAAMGWAGAHTVIVDRPEGIAGGQGLGFNGAQLMALTIGGCFCNDLRYVAHERGVDLRAIEVDVTIHLEGKPLLAAGADVSVRIAATDPTIDLEEFVRHTEALSFATLSVRRGFPVTFRRA
jgi:organic hydroperoxide reductase OsmC/OhrA